MSWTFPWAFAWMALPLVVLALTVAHFRWKSRILAEAGDPSVLGRLVDPRTRRQQWVKALFFLLGLALLVLAMAGPRWGQQFQEVRRRGVDVVIAVDVSASMLAEDIKPSRLTQAKRELGLFINTLEGDRVGIVAFAGSAFLQCPLTLDYGAARSLLDLLEPGVIPRPGTSLASAIQTALTAFPPGSGQHRALVLLTDGEDHSGQLDAAVERAVAEGLRVFTIGFGNTAGEIIPLRDASGQVTGYKKDAKGQTVVTKLDEGALQNIAAKTGGAYFPASQGEVEVAKIVEEIGRMKKKDLDSRVYGQGENHFRWPLALALFLLILEFFWPEVPRHWRRVGGDIRQGRWVPLALVWLLLPGRSDALGRYPRSGELAPLAQKNPGKADPALNLGHALYRENSFPAAAEAFEKAAKAAPDTPTKAAALYNAGNARYRQGKPEDAIEQYKQALLLNPSDMDAKHNLELAKKLSQQQKESKPSPQQGQPKNGDPQPKPGEMSKEEAQRLLETIAEQEKASQAKGRKQKQEPPVGEDW